MYLVDFDKNYDIQLKNLYFFINGSIFRLDLMGNKFFSVIR